ncbi:hypothetical protein KC19_VG267900 [Ceratodon purpureus]|uniref:Uncharacterized protein n=1 Tax=Ceratodon purpureus TaxID=3225 RepID=A0A8T0HUP1_CERPU|nr:hypothetical protein KC19_VG267800 [Ceratodon purpureus]KAG0574517.1 hypothetical protein KC19_VG267900 [Ceratodon purpureus]
MPYDMATNREQIPLFPNYFTWIAFKHLIITLASLGYILICSVTNPSASSNMYPIAIEPSGLALFLTKPFK